MHRDLRCLLALFVARLRVASQRRFRTSRLPTTSRPESSRIRIEYRSRSAEYRSIRCPLRVGRLLGPVLSEFAGVQCTLPASSAPVGCSVRAIIANDYEDNYDDGNVNDGANGNVDDNDGSRSGGEWDRPNSHDAWSHPPLVFGPAFCVPFP